MKRGRIILLLLLGLHLFICMNLRFTVWPEMMSYPYLFNKGFKLYGDFIYPYPPLLTGILAALYKVWGYEAWVLKIFTRSLLIVNDLLIYLIIKKITKAEKRALLGVGMYVLLQPFLEGNMMWFDVAMVTPLLAGLYFLLPKRKMVIAGIFLGVACLIKQTAVIFLVLCMAYSVYEGRERMGISNRVRNDVFRLLLGPVILGFLLLGYVLVSGVFVDFMNWTLIYPLTEWGKFPGYVEMGLSGRERLVMGLMAVPVVLFLKKNGGKRGIVLMFLVGGLISVYPRFSFFHFQMALAIVCVMAGASLNYWTAFLVIWGVVVVNHRLVVVREWQREARFWGKEDWEIAVVINEEVDEKERVFLLGLPSGLYEMADRLPPVPWTDNFGWYLEVNRVQEEIVERWDKKKPEVVFRSEPEEGNWYDLGTYQPKIITKWIEENYNREGEVWKGIWLWRKS